MSACKVTLLPRRPVIILENVDSDLLEKQRLALVRVLFYAEDLSRAACKKDLDLVTGILHMLDDWSDKRLKDGEG